MDIINVRYRLLLISLFLFLGNYCFAQHEYDHWVVPDQPDYEINFLCDSIFLNSTIANSDSGVIDAGASISNKKTGQLLFFTDGELVWNKNFQQMPNGFGLNGGWESTETSLIIPKPGNDSIFYIFTVDLTYGKGLNYSIVNMHEDNNLGDIIFKNIFLDSASQNIAAVYDNLHNSFWVIALDYVTNQFVTFKIDSNGVDSVPITSPCHVNMLLNYQVSGYLKSSPDGKNIIKVYEIPPLIGLYNFDSNTGLLSLKTFLPLQSNDAQAFGASFSPDNSKLYISAAGINGNNSEIYQYDLTSNDTNAIKLSRFTVDSIYAVRVFAGMQMGPDSKIYIVSENIDSLDVIEQPDSIGKSCGLILDKIPIPLPYTGNLGLSNNIDGLYYFATPDSNINVSYSIACTKLVVFTINTYRAYDFFSINFGDGKDTLLDSTQYSFTHQYDSIGVYTIKLNAVSGCIEDSVKISVKIDSMPCSINLPKLIIPTLIYGRGSQTQWQITNLPQGNNSVTIYDELGRTLYKTTNYPNNYDMRNLPPAMYFYRLTLESGQEYTGKIVLVK